MNPATRLMVEKLKHLAESGLSYREAAEELGATYHCIASYANKYNIPFRHLKRGRPAEGPDERSSDMRLLYEQGQTLEQIGRRYGITRERVRQIMTKHYGTRAANGGKAEITRQVRRARFKHRNDRSLKVWGCSYRDYRKLVKHPDKPTYAYWAQRKNAVHRGIGWELNLWQWWKTWEQSGHWGERGRGRGYGMCRLNDTGPYSVDNIYIATGVDNIRDYWINKRSAEIAA